MIEKVNIKKFGIFNDFEWDKSVGKDNTFKKVNIIYGRNYSGKTTLARIFKCIENNVVHEDYPDANFTVFLDDNKEITSHILDSYKDEIQLRVYNTDFVNRNLSWLYRDDGTIEPFTILGSINVVLETKIKAISEKLGSEDSKKGLTYNLIERTKEFDLKALEFNRISSALESKLKSKANDSIKLDATLFIPSANKKTYQINDIKSEIQIVEKEPDKYILKDSDIDIRKKLLSEQTKDKIDEITKTKTNFSEFYLAVKKIVETNIKPSQPIKELLDDALLQEWVRQGIEKHKDQRTTCGFCGNQLPKDLWDKLEAHFSKESEILRESITKKIEELEKAKTSLSDFLPLKKEMFYSTLQNKFSELLIKWNTERELYSENIIHLISDLKKRQTDIFKSFILKEINDNSNEILNIIHSFNQLISENNLKTQNLGKDQQDARKDLRLSVVSKFIKDIDYSKKIIEIETLEKLVKSLDVDKKKIAEDITLLSEEKKALERQAKDESRGAELINQHLTNFFGHDELKLVSEGESPNIKFKITRTGIEANNLSEGECSLISFCYFIAMMEDEMLDGLNNQRLAIYIDDPVSSLDSNHIFFMYSLIDTIIAKPKKYGQLFISTHNLDFLKFLKRLSIPDSNKDNVNYFLIERRQKKNAKQSVITAMPPHLRDYVTEFNYLFNEIYKVHKECKGDKKMMLENTYNQFYNLPNNIRKFLECYLFFKYPNNDDLITNLNRLFDDHVPCLINRVINEYSHLTYIDRGWKPIDVDEAEEVATVIINKIKEKDPDQFEELKKSIK